MTILNQIHLKFFELCKLQERDVELVLREKLRKFSPMKLRRNHDQLEENIKLIRNNKKLWQYLQVPLILNLFLLTYKPEMVDALRDMRGTSIFNELWRKYDDYIFSKKLPGKTASWIKIRSYTVWLSKLMKEGVFLWKIFSHPGCLALIKKERRCQLKTGFTCTI